MNVTVSARINASPEQVWAAFRDVPAWETWYGVPMVEANWAPGGYMRYAEHDGIMAGVISIGEYLENQRVVFTEHWTDTIYAVQPDGDGSVFTKTIIPKNGANFTASGYPSEVRKQQGYLDKFKELVESRTVVHTDNTPTGELPELDSAAAAAAAAGAASFVPQADVPADIPERFAQDEEATQIAPPQPDIPAGMPAGIPMGGPIPTSPGPGPGPQPGTPGKDPGSAKNKKKVPLGLLIGIGVAAVAVIVAAIILIPKLSEQSRIKQYNQGAEYLEQEKYEEALEVFEALGDYDNSQEVAAYIKKAIDYKSANDLMAKGKYADAKTAYQKLKGFKEADDLAAECDQAIAYEEGVALIASEDYTGAIEAFEKADGYKDSADKIAECEQTLEEIRIAEEQARLEASQNEIRETVERGDFEEALELLATDDGLLMEDHDELVAECENALQYEEAEAAFAEENFYTAYTLFSDLGDYRDAADRAGDCIIPKPATGELYRNSDYSNTNCVMSIEPPTGDGSCTYFKIYAVKDSEEILVTSIFINAGGKYSVRLPAGKYVFKAAYSFGDWYGEKEMFGDEGTYQRLKYTETSDQFVLDSGGDYTLSLRTASGGGNVDTKKEDPSGF